MPVFRILFPVIVFVISSCGTKDKLPEKPDGEGMRVSGYLLSQQSWADDMKDIDLKSVTDLNLAFFNPAPDASFAANAALAAGITAAHNEGVRVYMSIGGGLPPSHLADLIKADKRDMFISSILAFAKEYGFDGIDVDLENSLINEDYAPFVLALSKAIKPQGLRMTAALASWNGNQVHDSILKLYDFINIMSYDKTGPWSPERPGQHSPYTMVENDFTYYHEQRGIPAERLLVGLPFYGYGFGNGAPESMTYKSIVASYTGAADKDSVVLPAGGIIYYNGTGTIRKKTRFAISKKAAGVMIWQLKGDAKDDKSLLKAIHEEMKH